MHIASKSVVFVTEGEGTCIAKSSFLGHTLMPRNCDMAFALQARMCLAPRLSKETSRIAPRSTAEASLTITTLGLNWDNRTTMLAASLESAKEFGGHQLYETMLTSTDKGEQDQVMQATILFLRYARRRSLSPGSAVSSHAWASFEGCSRVFRVHMGVSKNRGS